MRTKVMRIPPDTILMRILDALAQEAIDASDDEVIAAAADLRMDLNSRESAAFAGLTFFARPQVSEFFDVDVFKSLQSPAKEIAGNAPAKSADRQRRPKWLQTATERKRPGK
jgi:hypothetical protein